MTALALIEQPAQEPAAAREVLIVRLGAEDYGLDILAVQEIRQVEAATRIANARSHVRGIINLRGVIVPIVDLRQLLGLPDAAGATTVTVIVNQGSRTIGLVVDAVSDVVALDPERIQPRPALGPQSAADFVRGLARLQQQETERLLLLLDLPALLRAL